MVRGDKMKVGDLVKVSNNGLTAIGYIADAFGNFYTVKYFAILESDHQRTMDTSGIWSEQYMRLLSSDKK
jgi:rRNA processing protein Gar1